MIEFNHLYKGLCGLARAHQAGPMAGHLGAAVIAGYFFGEDQPRLDDKVYSAIERELKRITGGEESLWFDPRKAGITIPALFEPFPEEQAQESGIRGIVDTLTRNIDKLRESGHNVIFAAIALRALHDHKMYATPSITSGIRKLIGQFDGAGSGRGYYGKQRGWIAGDQAALSGADEFPPYKDQHAMAKVTLDELSRSASVRRQGFGGLFHIINHAAALVELSMFGYQDLAQRGLAAHRQHVRLWRSLPDVENELGPLKRAQHDPRTPDYWSGDSPSQWSARLTHRIKTLYGFFALLRFTKDPRARKQAEEKFLYLMA